jgi:hypothetical protein
MQMNAKKDSIYGGLKQLVFNKNAKKHPTHVTFFRLNG